MSMNVINWHDLPCLLIDDYAAVYSKINNKLVVARFKKQDLERIDTYTEAENNGLFKWKYDNSFQETYVKLITLCLTEKCNSSCKYCFLDANTNGKTMSVDLMHSALDFAFNKFSGNTVIVSAFGGEPGTQEELISEMVRYSNINKDRFNIPEIWFSITTNGIISDSLMDLLIDNKFQVSLSMDGIEEVQNYQRPLMNNKDSFDKAIHSIKRLLSGGIDVKIRATVTDFSVDKMIESTHLFGNLGIKQLHYEPVTKGGRAQDSSNCMARPDPVYYASRLLSCIEVAKLYDMDINCTPYVRCDGSINSRLVIGADGMISSCIEVQNNRHPLSDSFKMGTIIVDGETVLENTEMRKIDDHCLSRDKAENTTKCKECPYILFCAGSCPTRNLRSTGCSHVTDPFKCELLRNIMPYILREFYQSTFGEEAINDGN